MIGIVACPFSGENPLEFLTSFSEVANKTTFTFTGLDFGAPAGDRYIIAPIAFTGAGDPSVTIGGISATIVAAITSGGSRSLIAYAKVPTGATGTVVVTLTSSATLVIGGVYRLRNIKAVTDSQTSTASDPTASVTLPARGAVIAMAFSTAAGGVFGPTWTGLPEDFNIPVGSTFIGAAASSQTNEMTSPVSVTADFSAIGVFGSVGSFASFETR